MPDILLPDSETEIDEVLVQHIIDTFNTVPEVQALVKVHGRERFLDNEEDDIEETTIPDLVVPNKIRRTSIIEIGIPTIEEFEYTADEHTQLNFVYPIYFGLEVVDKWDDPSLVYQNSRALAMAIYLKSRRAFKMNRTFGYANCVHDYLQQVNATTLSDEETGGRLHLADWSLAVRCTGILV